MKRNEILDTAKEYISNDRNKEAGEPEDNFRTIASFWSSYIKAAYNLPLELQPHDVAAMMILMKCSRIATSPLKDDHWIDVAGYGGCGGECAGKQKIHYVTPDPVPTIQAYLDEARADFKAGQANCYVPTAAEIKAKIHAERFQ